MGLFVYAEDVVAKTRIQSVKTMDTEDIELLLIVPAEKRIEEAFDLNLDTDAMPRSWAGIFETRSDLLEKFQRDMRISVFLLVDRMASNPHGYSSQSVRGTSVSYGRSMPQEIQSLMRQWGEGGAKTGRLFRR